MIHLTKTSSVCSSFDNALHHRTAIMFQILSKTGIVCWGYASFKGPVLSIRIGESITEGIKHRSAPIRKRDPTGNTVAGAGKAGAIICSADRSLFHFEEARKFVSASTRISIAALSSAIHVKSRSTMTLSPLENTHIRIIEPESICGALFENGSGDQLGSSMSGGLLIITFAVVSMNICQLADQKFFTRSSSSCRLDGKYQRQYGGSKPQIHGIR